MTNITQLRTPYHALGDGQSPRIPDWAKRRSVYRTSGRTLYLVETDQLERASRDISTLADRGWDIQIDRQGKAANIAFTRSAA